MSISVDVVCRSGNSFGLGADCPLTSGRKSVWLVLPVRTEGVFPLGWLSELAGTGSTPRLRLSLLSGVGWKGLPVCCGVRGL